MYDCMNLLTVHIIPPSYLSSFHIYVLFYFPISILDTWPFAQVFSFVSLNISCPTGLFFVLFPSLCFSHTLTHSLSFSIRIFFEESDVRFVTKGDWWFNYRLMLHVLPLPLFTVYCLTYHPSPLYLLTYTHIIIFHYGHSHAELIRYWHLESQPRKLNPETLGISFGVSRRHMGFLIYEEGCKVICVSFRWLWIDYVVRCTSQCVTKESLKTNLI